MNNRFAIAAGLSLFVVSMSACSQEHRRSTPESSTPNASPAGSAGSIVTTLEAPQPSVETALESTTNSKTGADTAAQAGQQQDTMPNANAQTTLTTVQPTQQTQTTITVGQAMQDLGAERVPEGIRIILPENVLFDFDKFNIRPDAQMALTKLSVVLQDHAGAPVEINGYTDSLGSVSYNQTLSQNRANSVKDYLVQHFSIPAAQLKPQGLGKTNFVAPNTQPDGSDNPAGRQKNRRVEVIIRDQ